MYAEVDFDETKVLAETTSGAVSKSTLMPRKTASELLSRSELDIRRKPLRLAFEKLPTRAKRTNDLG